MSARISTIGTRLGTGLRTLLLAALGLVWERPATRQVCPECAVDFVPALTDARCPICGWLAVEPSAAPRPRPIGVRKATGLGLAWFLGALAFALLAHALYA